MKRLTYILFSLVAVVLAFGSCKEEKKTEDIIVDKIVEKPQDSPVRMGADEKNGAVKWIGGAEYRYSIVRQSSDSLGVTENYGVKYYGNAINLKVSRADGTTFFQKTFTKSNFAPAMPAKFRDSGVLLGMNLEKAEGNELKFVVCIGSPDESNEDFVYVLMTLNNYGGTSASPYSGSQEVMD